MSAILLCEQREHSIEPIRLLRRVGARLQGQVEIETSVWSFAELDAPQVRTDVVRTAANAGILGVAADSHQPLTPAVRSLLVEALMVRLGRATSLLFFSSTVTPSNRSPSGVESYLRQLATSIGAAFFVTAFQPDVDASGRGLAASLRHLPPFGVRHWGINE